jgi:SAM-dependent methyltransferase
VAVQPQRAPDYDAVWRDAYGDMQDHGPVHRHMRRIVRRLLEPLEYRSVLEAGCGAGHNLPLLAAGRALDRLTGVDISDEALGRAARHVPGAELRRLDIERETLPGTWDLVFSSLVLEHLPDDRAALRNLRAMCGRHLLLTTIAGDFERYRAWDEQMGHVRNYRRGELEEKLGDAGFRVREAVYWGWPLYTPLTRTLQNGMSAEPSYSRATRVLAWAVHKLYYLNSARRGDLLVVLAEPR